MIAGDDAGSILAPVLQYGQAIEQALINRTTPGNADDSAHGPNPPRTISGEANVLGQFRRQEALQPDCAFLEMVQQ